ncbi:MAG: tRNA-dihydrouridine synthase, partial [Bdellovibrionales bacterium]|nr:tRNA-dihydrouridine synthase [Bdellovibrionales bacterium]
YIAEVKSKVKIPIIGNGDICTASQALTKLNKSRCDGVMIGRGCLKNPWLFQQAHEAWQSMSDLRPMALSHQSNFIEVFSKLTSNYSQHSNEKIMNLQLKKLSSWYSYGLPDSADFRKNIFQTESLIELSQNIKKYFSQFDSTNIINYSNDGFLMGGHG